MAHRQHPPPLLQRMLHAILNCLRYLASLVQSLLSRATGKVVLMDTGRQVRIGKRIAEGGFSYVFEAYGCDESSSRRPPGGPDYVLKRIRCPDPELLEACRREAGVHRSAHHPNLMMLLGMLVAEQDCYMLFPFFKHSLRAEVNRRTGLDSEIPTDLTKTPPWNEVTALRIFLGVARGVKALHRIEYSHRDVKLENVLLEDSSPRSLRRPVLMDFGSAGPLQVHVESRRQLLHITEEAAQHTTVSYRPPELFEGGIVLRGGSNSETTVVDYGKVDVWSLGCTLFATLYGASPCESEFARGDGRLKIVECTQLKVLAGVPKPPQHAVVSDWYSPDTLQLIEDMLRQDRDQRPNLDAVLERVESLIVAKGGEVDKDVASVTGGGSRGYASGDDDDDDGIALMSVNI